MQSPAAARARLGAHALLLVAVAAPRLGAQQERQVEGHASYARETRSHEVAWGAGALYELVWGPEEQPVRLGTAVGADFQKGTHGGPGRTTGALELTLEAGGGLRVTPYFLG